MKESIIRQVFFLIVVVILNMVIISLVHGYMQRRISFLQHLTENELVKVELSYLSHENLQDLRLVSGSVF